MLPLTVALLAVAASISGILNQYAQDDIPIIGTNAAVHSLGGIGKLFVQSYWPPPYAQGLYRPFTLTSLALQWAAGGGSPLILRLVSYGLYAAASVGVFFLARLLLPAGVAGAVAALFAVHPVHVEAVAVAVNQGELWVGLLCCVAVILYVRERRRGGPIPVRSELILAGLYLAACLFKETALVLPGLLVLAEILLVPSIEPLAVRISRVRRLLLVLLLVGTAFMGVRTRVMRGNLAGTFTAEGLVDLTVNQRAITMLSVVPEWFRLLLWPAHLQADYSPGEIVGQTSWGPAQTPGLALLVAAVVAATLARRRAPAICFGIGWCAIGLFPVHNVLVPTGIILAERTLFLPSIGAMIALGGIGNLIVDRVSPRYHPALVAVLGALLMLGTWRSTTRHSMWLDQWTIWSRTAEEDAPRSYRAHEFMAQAYYDIGQERMAEQEYRLAIQFSPPKLTGPRSSLADKLRSRGFSYPAAQLYREIVRARPNHSAARLALGACLVNLGLYREAMFHARMGISFEWELAAFRTILGTADSALRVSAPPGTVRVPVAHADSAAAALLRVGTGK
jgi:hypothetical protein